MTIIRDVRQSTKPTRCHRPSCCATASTSSTRDFEKDRHSLLRVFTIPAFTRGTAMTLRHAQKSLNVCVCVREKRLRSRRIQCFQPRFIIYSTTLDNHQEIRCDSSPDNTYLHSCLRTNKIVDSTMARRYPIEIKSIFLNDKCAIHARSPVWKTMKIPFTRGRVENTRGEYPIHWPRICLAAYSSP